MIFDQSDEALIEAYQNLLRRQTIVSDPDVLELIAGKLILFAQELQLRQYAQDESLNWYPLNRQDDPNPGGENA